MLSELLGSKADRLTGAAEARGEAEAKFKTVGRASVGSRPTTILVQPLEVGWTVTVAGVSGHMAFLSGAAAESAARRLATRLGWAGTDCEVILKLRDGSVAARFLAPAATRGSLAPAPMAA